MMEMQDRLMMEMQDRLMMEMQDRLMMEMQDWLMMGMQDWLMMGTQDWLMMEMQDRLLGYFGQGGKIRAKTKVFHLPLHSIVYFKAAVKSINIQFRRIYSITKATNVTVLL